MDSRWDLRSFGPSTLMVVRLRHDTSKSPSGVAGDRVHPTDVLLPREQDAEGGAIGETTDEPNICCLTEAAHQVLAGMDT